MSSGNPSQGHRLQALVASKYGGREAEELQSQIEEAFAEFRQRTEEERRSRARGIKSEDTDGDEDYHNDSDGTDDDYDDDDDNKGGSGAKVSCFRRLRRRAIVQEENPDQHRAETLSASHRVPAVGASSADPGKQMGSSSEQQQQQQQQPQQAPGPRRRRTANLPFEAESQSAPSTLMRASGFDSPSPFEEDEASEDISAGQYNHAPRSNMGQSFNNASNFGMGASFYNATQFGMGQSYNSASSFDAATSNQLPSATAIGMRIGMGQQPLPPASMQDYTSSSTPGQPDLRARRPPRCTNCMRAKRTCSRGRPCRGCTHWPRGTERPVPLVCTPYPPDL